jgi:tRNA (guanine-N7-)-methyltransferase
MGKKKLIHLEELKTFANVLRPPLQMKGGWSKNHFGNEKPITLELACGKGEYTVELARRFPKRNFIGIDIKGSRIWRGARTALDENLTNVAYVVMLINDIDDVFEENEVNEIWITFPDPYPKRRHAKHRLTSPYFLNRYRKIMVEGGLIHLKTDDSDLFEYTRSQIEDYNCETIRVTEDVHAEISEEDYLSIQTAYEKKYLKAGKTIKYICFRFNSV